MKAIVTILIFLLSGCGTEQLQPVRPIVRVDTIRVTETIRDTVNLNDTVYLPQRYVLIRSCVTDVNYSMFDTATYNIEFPPNGDWSDSNGVLMRLRFSEKAEVRTEVRDTITFTDGKFFWPSHLCNCWGCLDSLRIEKIEN